MKGIMVQIVHTGIVDVIEMMIQKYVVGMVFVYLQIHVNVMKVLIAEKMEEDVLHVIQIVLRVTLIMSAHQQTQIVNQSVLKTVTVSGMEHTRRAFVKMDGMVQIAMSKYALVNVISNAVTMEFVKSLRVNNVFMNVSVMKDGQDNSVMNQLFIVMKSPQMNNVFVVDMDNVFQLAILTIQLLEFVFAKTLIFMNDHFVIPSYTKLDHVNTLKNHAQMIQIVNTRLIVWEVFVVLWFYRVVL
jgi:hypothetical protein